METGRIYHRCVYCKRKRWIIRSIVFGGHVKYHCASCQRTLLFS